MIKPLEVARTYQPYEVGKTAIVFGQKHEVIVRSPPTGNRRSIAMVARSDVHLTPNDRTDTGFNRGFVELERTKKVTVVCYRNRRHSKAGNLSSKVRNPDRRIEQRVVGVEM